MRKNVKKKDKEEDCRIGEEDCRIGEEEIAGSEMEEKREEEWKVATRKRWRNIETIMTMVKLGYKEDEKNEEEEEKEEKEEKREKGVEIQEKEEQLMINFNEAKLMNGENWIETTKMRKNLFEETDEEICKKGKMIAGSEMQMTIEEEWKAETRDNEGKEKG